MKNWWIKFGCFLTGYNYGILRNSSEVAAKAVKRYTAALMIVCILWSFIGFSFTNRYLHGGTWGSLFGAIIFVVIIIQIERQIILSINPPKRLYFFRGVIAFMMAIIGAIIIDQIIFKEDIDLRKMESNEAKVETLYKSKTGVLRSQIATLGTYIDTKERERASLINDVSNSPTIKIFETLSRDKTEKIKKKNPTTGNDEESEKTVPINITTSSNVANPKIALIAPLQQTINTLRTQKLEKETALLNIRPQLERQISSKVGFLDELEVMYSLIKSSVVALIVWLIWFIFLFGLEMLVLISKANEKENDYEKTVKHHMDLQMKKLELFAQMAETNGRT